MVITYEIYYIIIVYIYLSIYNMIIVFIVILCTDIKNQLNYCHYTDCKTILL